MRPLSRPPLLLLSLLCLALVSPALTALTSTPGSFCKCICNTNSTIIALSPSTTTSPARVARASASASGTPPKHHKLTCADCTRSFCASYNLPICKDVDEDKIFTSCFQRDSLKDELVIYLFLAVTTGLLVWAGAKPWIEKLWEKSGFGGGALGSGVGRSYVPVGPERGNLHQHSNSEEQQGSIPG